MTTPSTTSSGSGGVTGAGSSGSPRSGLPGQRGSDSKPHRPADYRPREITVGFLVGRLIALGLVAALLVFGLPPLIRTDNWIGVGVLVAAGAGIAYLYLSRRHVPLKYLLPGTVFLVVFQLVPVILTVSTAFTNFGDGHRGTKEEAITAIQTSSLEQVAGAASYNLSPALKDGKLVFLLVPVDDKGEPLLDQAKVGTPDGLTELPGLTDANLSLTKQLSEVPGYDILSKPDASARGDEIANFAVPTEQGAIKSSGLSKAVELTSVRDYDAACDCVKDTKNGKTYTADAKNGYFRSADGETIAQGWKVNVGLANFTRIFTDKTVSGNFFAVFVWNFAFAAASVLTTFALGLLCALALHSPRMRGTKIYRVIIILPYAMPSFAMLLVWRDMFNKDFGLINNLFGWHIDWLGEPMTARMSLILVNLWLGFPYMFLVATGALQAIPRELTEASSIDGATAWQGFRRVTLPLLLVALTPLLISSFAYNFNNFNAIKLVTDGGPYAIDNATVGATDLLISYTYRLAFGGIAQLGFAAAVSVIIFTLVAIMSIIGFRRSRSLEEVYS
ncbi:MAG: ABC transporter permease subunit [Hamadaea sp.]|uniref:ABC transporter permease subunit n=1 Tax=Hamadaea sp. TaxID=2024425 RepID=UPI00181FBDE9|nr:ABC transporter permease subunit [Hamadaea sp.]NUR70638.1 ABC transporter permease subunit [Hamadaea sp.]NUT18393.1 ABC transporter permease subunit [Hamadaea sp.]